MDLAKLRARMTKRNVAGTSLPRQDRTSKFLENELKRAGKTGYAGESGVVEGGAARPRLDRPARAAGGRVMKAQNQGEIDTKPTVGRQQDHEDRTSRTEEDRRYMGADSEKGRGAKDAYEHRNDDVGEKKTEHWAKGGRVVNDHHDHGKARKKRDLEKHDRLKNHEHEDTAFHGSGDGEHEELFAKGGAVTHSKEHDPRGAKERKEVLRRHDRLKNHVHESSRYGHGWEDGPYGKGFAAHKAEMHGKMPGQHHPSSRAHGGTVKASDDYDGHGHFKGKGFEHKHKAQLYNKGGSVEHEHDSDCEKDDPEHRGGGDNPAGHRLVPKRKEGGEAPSDPGDPDSSATVGALAGSRREAPPPPPPKPDPNSTMGMGRMNILGREQGGAIHVHHEHHHHHHIHRAAGGDLSAHRTHEFGRPDSGKIMNQGGALKMDGAHGALSQHQPENKASGGVPDSDNRSISRDGRMEGPVHRKDGGSGKWIQHAVPASHKGRLHKALGVPQGEPIPEKKLEKAEHSSNPHMQHMAQFAERMKGLKK